MHWSAWSILGLYHKTGSTGEYSTVHMFFYTSLHFPGDYLIKVELRICKNVVVPFFNWNLGHKHLSSSLKCTWRSGSPFRKEYKKGFTRRLAWYYSNVQN